MSQTSRISTAPQPGAPGTSGWVGWIAFSALMLGFIGLVHIFEGLVALVNHTYYKVGESGLLVHASLTTWGWVHIAGGVLLLGAAFGVFAAQVWARTVGVLVALGSALVHLAFLAAQPILSTVMIGFCVVVIMALTVHGSEIRAETN